MAQPASHAKMQTWMIVLLVWIIALILFVAGYQIYGQKNRSAAANLTPEELAAACAEAIKDEEPAPTPEPADCPEPAAETRTLKASKLAPGFSYPMGWHITQRPSDSEDPQSSGATTYINNDPIIFCAACDGPVIPVTIATTIKTTTRADYGAAVIAQYDGATYRNVTKSSEELGKGVLTKVSGTMDGLYSGEFEDWIYETDKTLVVIRTIDVDLNSTGDNQGWETIKTTLDFSQIE